MDPILERYHALEERVASYTPNLDTKRLFTAFTFADAAMGLKDTGHMAENEVDGMQLYSITSKGLDMVDKYIKPLMNAELAAVEVMGQKETREYLRLNKLYAEALESQIGKMTNNNDTE